MHFTTFAILPAPSVHLHQSAASFFKTTFCFLQFVPSISSSVNPVYDFHLLHVPLPSSKRLPYVISNCDHTSHTIHPCKLICCFLQSQHVHQLLCIPLFQQLYITHHPHHRSFCSSQNSYFIFPLSTTLNFI